MFARVFTPVAAGSALAFGVAAGLSSKPAANSTASTIDLLTARVAELEKDLGIKKVPSFLPSSLPSFLPSFIYLSFLLSSTFLPSPAFCHRTKTTTLSSAASTAP
jgi:hypothetical protein